MKVLKFGGSSIATPERVEHVVSILKSYSGENLTVVLSAFGGVTDQLIQMAHLAVKGDLSYQQILTDFEKRHTEAVNKLFNAEQATTILTGVNARIEKLKNVTYGIYLVRERTPRTLDYIMSFGERLSAYIISESLKARGITAEYLDARKVILTDDHFGNAKVNFEITNRQIAEYFHSHTQFQVVTGFIASAPTGETTTLGRSGSDYTASIIAGALHAEQLEIWTDVNGMMTADPRLVRKSFSVPRLSYEEAMELSHFGAKVIFPATMLPAMAHHIPILIKNTFDPNDAGTFITAESSNGKLVKGISSIKEINLLNIQGSGLVGVVGFSKRLFTALAQEKINIVLISQASSEHSICIAVEKNFSHKAKTTIEHEFRYELKENLVDEIKITSNLAIIAVVGDGMKHHPGTSGKMFSALGKNGINVSAIAQGSSERNISAVIAEADVAKALNTLHDAFFLSHIKTLHVFLVGTGLIGKALIQQIRDQFKKLSTEQNLEIKIAGIANSRKMIFNEEGLNLSNIIETMDVQGEQMNSSVFLQTMKDLNLSNSVFIDCTASEEIANHYHTILAENISIVTPNKKANSSAIAYYKNLKETARKRGVRFLYETNVGAGLPVINTLNDLLLSGDKVIKIEAVLSGTLNYIFSSFTEGKKFSEVVMSAKEKGFTEPDPRDDLSGMDVARKILILSRETGLDLELSQIEVQNLVPEDCRKMDCSTFLHTFSAHDEHFEKLRHNACVQNKKLRYQATLDNDKVKVELNMVDSNHPFYTLAGSDNIILLTTERYQERPMVIRGPGAGAEVTAAGVFADVIRIGNYSN